MHLNQLPDLPQATLLQELLSRIWADPTVVALWLGGSLANGRGDAYSDVDLRIAVAASDLAAWRTINLEALFQQAIPAQFLLPFSETTFLHHLILESGEIYDLYVQSIEQPLSKEKRLIFGCRDKGFLAKLEVEEIEIGIVYEAAKPAVITDLINQFWIILHKGQKTNYRNLYLLNWEGINLLRFILLRLYYIQATGNDCGDLRRMTIHSWTPIVETIQTTVGEKVFTLIGSPIITKADVVKANALLYQELATVGRALAQQFNFVYPEGLETMVLQNWTNFVEREMPDSE